MNLSQQKIYFIISPHINYYHSYRGDSRGIDGFGKDLDLMRAILDKLDEIEDRGLCGGNIPVTWDYSDTFWSIQLQKEFQQDILDRVIERCRGEKDEVLIGTWGNVGLPFLDTEEFLQNFEWLMENEMGIGLEQLFPGRIAPYLRAQETMFTQGMIELYNKCGIEGVCNYYSVYEFDVGRPLIYPRLTPNQRYGLTKFKSTISEASCLMIPMYAFGDILDFCSIKRWFKIIRKMQKRKEITGHALLFFNFDMDYENWIGVNLPKFLQWMPNTRGLEEFAEAVDELEYVEFANLIDTIPKLKVHGETYIRQDIADGYWNGYYNWAQKYNNTKFWTVGQRARWLKSAANTLISENVIKESEEKVNEKLYGENDKSNSYLKNKILFASTTNFGLALPFQHPHRRKTAMKYGLSAFNASKDAMEDILDEFSERITKENLHDKNILFIQPIINRGRSEREHIEISSPILINYEFSKDIYDKLRNEKKGIKLINPSSNAEDIQFKLNKSEKNNHYILEAILPPIFFNNSSKETPYLIIEGTNDRKKYEDKTLIATQKILKNEHLQIEINEKGFIKSVKFQGKEFACSRFLESAVTYGPSGDEKRYSPENQKVEILNEGINNISTSLKFYSKFEILPGKEVKSEMNLKLYRDLPYIFIQVQMNLPEIKGKTTSEDGVEFVKEAFNEKWKEIMPCEIKPQIFGKDDYLRIWKKNFLGVVDYFDLNMKLVDDKNADIDCLVSNISDGWMGLSNQKRGMVVGFNSLKAANFAFAPIKVRDNGFKDCGENFQQIRINPFGTYFGRSFHYWTEGNEHAQKLLPKMMRLKKSTAPTFSGKTVSFELILCPYEGDCPPESVQSMVDNYSFSPLLLLKPKNKEKLYHNFQKYNKHAKALIKQYEIEDLMDMSYLEWVRKVNKNYDPSQKSAKQEMSLSLGLKTMLTLLIDGIRGR
ncbi:MAG: hypothetical protein EU541_07185 [Promethearchaeota archaeon]|nr:MAG: hypothetical protein EU541_07185 [Candidatus Lokiarchaeota archaeon]